MVAILDDLMNSFENDKDKRKSKPPFNYQREQEIQQLIEDMIRLFDIEDERIFSDLIKQASKPNARFIRGYTISFDSEGKPTMREFGNKPMLSNKGEPVISEEREPLIDLMEQNEHLTITMEIPGVEKQDIDLRIKNNILEIDVDTPGHYYYKQVDLPCRVEEKSTKATYNNGILDITIKKKNNPGTNQGYDIPIS